MFKQWIGCAPDNFLVGRKGHRVEAVVIHAYPSIAAADALFKTPGRSESCHYLIANDGTIRQYVDENDTAFHAGLVINPTWSLHRQGINPNLRTVGIAAAIADGESWSDVLYAALTELIRDIARHWQFELDARHVVLHREIRASKHCTGAGFRRDHLLKLLAAPAATVTNRIDDFVQLTARANLRLGQPNTQAPVVRTLAAGVDLRVVGFTDRGERIKGNGFWYETEDQHFVWAGATDKPQPLASQPAIVKPAQSSETQSLSPLRAARVPCGIARIDRLLQETGEAGIGSNEPAGDAVGAIQDLLSGHGVKGMPSILSSVYGRFGSKTVEAVKAFQASCELPVTGTVDHATLTQLTTRPATKPLMSQAYLTLVLGVPYRGMQKILSIVAQMEGVGLFGALNLNTDQAGLSYGIIQWAQRPGRLPELLKAFSAADRPLFVDIFGNGDAALADQLIAYVAKPNGGVNPRTGVALNSAFNLVASPWTDRFKKATVQTVFQKAQIKTATDAFLLSLKRIHAYAPNIRSERGIAFMLDVANQFGDGGLKKLYAECQGPGMTEMDILEAIADETVERMPDRFKQGVRARRDGFLETSRLSNQTLTDSELTG